MMVFFTPIFSVTLVLFINLFRKHKEPFRYYMKLFVIVLVCELSFYLIRANAEEARVDYVINGPYKTYVSTLRNIVDKENKKKAKDELRLQLRESWFKFCVDLKLKGYKELEHVRWLSIFIPDDSKKLMVESAIDSLAASLITQSWQSKLVAATALTCASYLKGVYSKWDEMDAHFKEAQKLFYFSEMYQDLLFRDDELEEVEEEEDYDDCEDEYCSSEKIYRRIRSE